MQVNAAADQQPLTDSVGLQKITCTGHTANHLCRSASHIPVDMVRLRLSRFRTGTMSESMRTEMSTTGQPKMLTDIVA